MRDHDEVFRRVMEAKEQYEQQKKEKSMFRFMKSAPGGGATDEKEGRREPSKAFVWAMRAVAALVCIAMIGGIIAAVVLGSKGKNTKEGRVGSGESGENPTQQVSNNPTEGVTGTPQAEGRTLTIWCDAVEGSYMKDGFELALADMRTRYPDVTVNVVTYADVENEYKTALKAAIQEHTAPDIFYAWDGESFKDLVELGQVYCLDNVYANYADVLPEAACGSTTYNGRKYGAPYTFTANAIFVNMDVLRSVGINTVPGTYDDMIECFEALSMRGITPVACATGPGQEWVMGQLLEQLMLKNVGAQTLEAVFRGEASWQTAGIAEAVELFEEFVREGYIYNISRDGGPDDDTVKEDFEAGRYAFYVSGSWSCPELSACESDIVVMEFPVINSRDAGSSQYLTGPVGAFSVYNGSSDKELAAQYAMELAQLVSKYVFLDEGGLPAWKVNYDTTGVDALSARVAEMTQHANAFVPFGDNTMDINTLMEYTKLIRKAYNGEITGSVFTASMASAAGQ
ncbi:MAG: extracellular solute-binding protein [Lachnospiraceae bacterium]|nr:extracellular solute-binding protein [Lachnospiraceae bacterium]